MLFRSNDTATTEIYTVPYTFPYTTLFRSERLTIEECADEVMSLLDDPTFQETPESRRFFQDLALAAHVRAALRQDDRTKKMQISVTTHDGVVTLAGIVEMGLEPKDATEAASKVRGVSEVVNTLRMAMESARHHVT